MGWEEDFEKWESGKSPASVSEVRAIIERVFSGRIKKGTKHRWKVMVPELVGLSGFKLPFITVPLKDGQRVKGPYLQTLYAAATHERLELYRPQREHRDHEPGNEETMG